MSDLLDGIKRFKETRQKLEKTAEAQDEIEVLVKMYEAIGPGDEARKLDFDRQWATLSEEKRSDLVNRLLDRGLLPEQISHALKIFKGEVPYPKKDEAGESDVAVNDELKTEEDSKVKEHVDNNSKIEEIKELFGGQVVDMNHGLDKSKYKVRLRLDKEFLPWVSENFARLEADGVFDKKGTVRPYGIEVTGFCWNCGQQCKGLFCNSHCEKAYKRSHSK